MFWRPVQIFYTGRDLSLSSFIFTTFIFTALPSTTIKAWAEASAPASCEYSQTIHAPLHYPQVELIARHQSIGLYRGGEFRLNPWIPISDRAVIGVDAQGRLLNVLQLQDRTIAFLLSGTRRIRDVFHTSSGQLLAVDDRGRVLRFDSSRWARTTWRQIVKAAANRAVTLSCSSGLAILSYGWIVGLKAESPEVLGALGLASLTTVFTEAFRATLAFERDNQETDGMTEVGPSVREFRRSDSIRDGQGRIQDYEIVGKQTQSLNALLATLAPALPESFDVKCEHELLARGIPPEQYEPTLK